MAEFTLNTHATLTTMSASEFDLLASENDSTYVVVQSYVVATLPTAATEYTYVVTSSHISYRYWRIRFKTKFTGGLDYIHYRQVRFKTNDLIAPRLVSYNAYQTTVNTFRIDMFGTDDKLLDVALGLWYFNIVLFKNRAIVNSGLYRFDRKVVNGVGWVNTILEVTDASTIQHSYVSQVPRANINY